MKAIMVSAKKVCQSQEYKGIELNEIFSTSFLNREKNFV